MTTSRAGVILVSAGACLVVVLCVQVAHCLAVIWCYTRSDADLELTAVKNAVRGDSETPTSLVTELQADALLTQAMSGTYVDTHSNFVLQQRMDIVKSALPAAPAFGLAPIHETCLTASGFFYKPSPRMLTNAFGVEDSIQNSRHIEQPTDCVLVCRISSQMVREELAHLLTPVDTLQWRCQMHLLPACDNATPLSGVSGASFSERDFNKTCFEGASVETAVTLIKRHALPHRQHNAGGDPVSHSRGVLYSDKASEGFLMHSVTQVQVRRNEQLGKLDQITGLLTDAAPARAAQRKGVGMPQRKIAGAEVLEMFGHRNAIFSHRLQSMLVVSSCTRPIQALSTLPVTITPPVPKGVLIQPPDMTFV
jgi:hypothetical protein